MGTPDLPHPSESEAQKIAIELSPEQRELLEESGYEILGDYPQVTLCHGVEGLPLQAGPKCQKQAYDFLGKAPDHSKLKPMIIVSFGPNPGLDRTPNVVLNTVLDGMVNYETKIGKAIRLGKGSEETRERKLNYADTMPNKGTKFPLNDLSHFDGSPFSQIHILPYPGFTEPYEWIGQINLSAPEGAKKEITIQSLCASIAASIFRRPLDHPREDNRKLEILDDQAKFDEMLKDNFELQRLQQFYPDPVQLRLRLKQWYENYWPDEVERLYQAEQQVKNWLKTLKQPIEQK